MSAIADLTCTALTHAYRRGALSPVEVARDMLARIERNAALNAFLAVEADAVLAAAKDSEARWRAAAPLGAIDGVPASIKDNIWAKGLPTRRGSKTSDPSPAQADSPAVARLREQGAIILGKTTMPEHGWTASAIVLLRASPAIRGTPRTRRAARPAAGRWPPCWVWACCIWAPTAPARCESRRRSPACSA